MAYNVFSSPLSINSVLVILLALAVALASPIHQTIINSPKVFVVGLPQTGTKSVGDALEKFSFRRPELKDFYSRYLYYMFSANYTAPLISYAQEYDILEDIPWAIAYKELATAFPDAKFILTLRANESAWLESIDKHTHRHKWKANKRIFGCKKVRGEECIRKYLDAYRAHVEGVRDFFDKEGNGRLLEVIIDAPMEMRSIKTGGEDTTVVDDKWLSLIDFLQLEGRVERLGGWGNLGLFPESTASNKAGKTWSKLQHAWDRMLNACENGIWKGVKSTVKVVKVFGFLAARGL
ncbi:uncharacterized protein BHQ10_002712 [Talaromyces amestolkiae]|uniref:Sulfotransferase domain-containing protein n=1 Tax=Talaromyces amestolkiae TaxID=1196081 RepID=A0A364KT20_TALAM|nr:uncharacterized protein BHQ10_002712 [Talaromyces amestolkiae]RAO66700.1 hypothetical protein BHQ10_002712 [Talaromyces amestolkiae]